MLDKVMSIIAPHHCCGCDKIGALLCANCKNNIIDSRQTFCVSCLGPTSGTSLCSDCHAPYSKAWVVERRAGLIQRVIGLYKFERAISAYSDLGDLILEILPDLPSNTVIIPIPTTSRHIRERGYDHMLLIAKYIAKKRKLKCLSILKRKTNTMQRHANADLRLKQAKNAFTVEDYEINPDIPYLIIDDVVTTGATIKYAAKILKKAGAKHIWVAALARQI